MTNGLDSLHTIAERVRHLEAELKRWKSPVSPYGAPKLATLSRPGTIYTPADGWIPVSSTWTYASATTITVPSGAAAIYSVGDKWKLTANSVVLQGYIVGVADTLLTTLGNALTDHTFSAISYSKAATPLGFPSAFSYTPTPTYAGGTTDPTSWNSLTGSFSVTGKIASVMVYGSLNRGTGNRTYVILTLPIVYSLETAPSCVHTLISSAFALAPSYLSASKINVALGAAMNNNGYLWINATYRI